MSTLETKHASLRLSTLADLIDRIGTDPALPRRTRLKWCSAIRGLARGARKPPGLLPANGAKLAKAMNAAGANRHHAEVSKESWRQYWSDWRSAGRHYGLVIGKARNTAPRSEAWNALLVQLGRTARISLTRFASEMSQRGVEPYAVGSEHFEIFRQALEAAVVAEPASAFTAMANAWRTAQCANIGWPDVPAPTPEKRPPFWRTWAEFPESLEADIDAFYAHRTMAKVFDVAKLFCKPTGDTIRPATAVSYKSYLRALASGAAAAGVSLQQLKTLKDLLDLEVVEAAMNYLVKRRIGVQRQAGRTDTDDKLVRGSYHYNIAHHVLTVLRQHFNVPEGELAELVGCVEQLAPKHRGMAPTTRAQLDVLLQPEIFVRLFRLPERLFAALEHVEEATADNAWTAALGLALAIALDTAFRRANVAGLRIDRHLGPTDRSGRMLVEIPEDEAKNDSVYVAELRPRTVQLLETYRTRWQQHIFPGETPFLFPDETGAGADPRRFSSRLSRLVTRRIGVHFTMHRIRSLLATLYAEANPGDERTAQIKLGHKSPRSTQMFYIAPQQKSAIRRFDKLIDDLVAGRVPAITHRAATMETCHDTL
jgi:integrase